MSEEEIDQLVTEQADENNAWEVAVCVNGRWSTKNMETTIDKAERLAHYLKIQHRKSDARIDPVLDKLLDQERQTLQKQRIELRAELDQFEQQYTLESSEFHAKFERGEMGDDMDFFDWSATWRMYQSTLSSLETLSPNAAPS